MVHQVAKTSNAVAVQLLPVVGVDTAGEIVRIFRSDTFQVVLEQLREVVRCEGVATGVHVEDRNTAVRNLRQQRQLGDMAFQHRVVQFPGVEPLGVQQLFVFALQCLHY